MTRACPILGLFLLGLTACAAPGVRVENPSSFASGDYDRVFDAAIAELRDRRFVVERTDRRFGVITTRPQKASTLAEPWSRDDTSGRRRIVSTLNADRRRVVVRLWPREPVADGAVPALYQIAVEVTLERRHYPPRQLITSATAPPRLTGRGRDRYDRSLRTEEGREETFWEPRGRDTEMEGGLLAGVLTRASGATVSAAETPPGHAQR